MVYEQILSIGLVMLATASCVRPAKTTIPEPGVDQTKPTIELRLNGPSISMAEAYGDPVPTDPTDDAHFLWQADRTAILKGIYAGEVFGLVGVAEDLGSGVRAGALYLVMDYNCGTEPGGTVWAVHENSRSVAPPNEELTQRLLAANFQLASQASCEGRVQPAFPDTYTIEVYARDGSGNSIARKYPFRLRNIKWPR